MRRLRVSLGAFAALLLAVPALFAPRPASAELVPVVARYSSVLASVNGNLSAASRANIAERLLLLSSYYQVDPRLLLAIVSVESSWRSTAVSPVGAMGYGQLMPATAANLKVQSLEPYENLDGTARYLRRLLMRYAALKPEARVRLAVASYNAGPYAVDRYHGVPPYRQTQDYVRRVLAQWQRFSTLLDAPSERAVATLVNRAATTPAPAAPESRQYARARSRTDERVSRTLAQHVLRPSRLAAPARSMIHLAATSITHDTTLAVATPEPVVRYEPSHSFFARLLGIKHKVVAPAVPDTPNVY
ncbi:MAG TPA: lytic transglycosylase domain-containing protein [Candidatus Sulfotelmatobacter sp.]|nr:lytic transglycosylase domain-containing protein [Candidatus Sulfotelmatobacter sp.]